MHSYSTSFSVNPSLQLSLPDELLAHIMISACSSKPPFLPCIGFHMKAQDHCEESMPIVMGSVSSQWRRVALATPQLWTSFTVVVKLESAETTVLLIRLHLERSSGHPVYVGLNLIQVQKEITQRTLASPTSVGLLSKTALNMIKNVLDSRHCGPIAVLRLLAPPREWLALSGLQYLDHLWIEWPRELPTPSGGVEPPVGCSSSVHHLTFIRFWTPIQIHSGSLVSVNLEQIPIDICVWLLTSCVRLVDYRSRLPVRPFRDTFLGEGLLENQVRLPCLKVLKWANTGHSCCTALLRQLECPNLRHLAWSGYYHSEADPAFQSFLSRLPSSLESLELGGFSNLGRPTFVRDIFHHTPLVSELCLRGCDTAFLSTVMVLLTSHDTLGTILLPVLRTLTCHETLDAEACPEVLSGIFCAMMERMRYGVETGFLLNVDKQMFDWRPEVQKSLKKMLEKGVKLRIVEDGVDVDWLA